MDDEKVKIPLGSGAMNAKILFRWYDETHTFLDAVAAATGANTSELIRSCVYRSLKDLLSGLPERKIEHLQAVHAELLAARPALDRRTYDGKVTKPPEQFWQELFDGVGDD